VSSDLFRVPDVIDSFICGASEALNA